MISLIPGVLLGLTSVKLFFQFAAQLTHTTPAVILKESLIQAFLFLFIMYAYIMLYIVGYVYHIDIKQLLANRNNITVITEAPKRKYSNRVFYSFFFGSVLLMLVPILSYDKLSLLLVFCLMGIYGMVNGVLTRTIFKLKRDKFFTNRYFVISTSNFSSTLLTNKITILSMIFSIILMFVIDVGCATNISNFLLSLAGYVISIVLLSFTMAFDLLTQAKQRTVYYLNLWKIGYTRKELMKIMSQELCMLYGFIIGCVFLVIGSIGLRNVMAGAFSGLICLYMIVFFVVFVLLTWLLTFFIYRRTINKAIVEEK